eukprot:CAMPEP_0118933748 /NCGR_PEP_ID=MMETSP1169-20130426/12348_1 /TAXON_ID=36882 /ORGANISM="Pyramimonas obovata, Strain CCMP722" /LENGTH=118 /DNA_ID=CAMNT_0006876557 /DNA_START=347 /DNA_END=700 /DNA_ORIENTATION=+
MTVVPRFIKPDRSAASRVAPIFALDPIIHIEQLHPETTVVRGKRNKKDVGSAKKVSTPSDVAARVQYLKSSVVSLPVTRCVTKRVTNPSRTLLAYSLLILERCLGATATTPAATIAPA